MPVHPESFHDPNIIYVGEPTTLPANAAPPVDVYVADLSEDNAFRIAANTGVKTPIPGASYAEALASDRSGNVFLAEPGNLGVIKLPAGGGPETILADGLVQPYGVAVDWADNVYTVGKTLDAGSTFKALKIPADGGPPIVIWTETERIPSAIAVDIPGNAAARRRRGSSAWACLPYRYQGRQGPPGPGRRSTPMMCRWARMPAARWRPRPAERPGFHALAHPFGVRAHHPRTAVQRGPQQPHQGHQQGLRTRTRARWISVQFA